METVKQIEDGMAEILLTPSYPAVQAEYNRLLGIMGNVDGDEVISLVLLAVTNASNAIDWWQ